MTATRYVCMDVFLTAGKPCTLARYLVDLAIGVVKLIMGFNEKFNSEF